MMKAAFVFSLFVVAITLYSCAPTQSAANGQVRAVYKEDDRELSTKPEPIDKAAFEQWLYEHNQQLQAAAALKGVEKVTLVLTVDDQGNLLKPMVWRGIGAPFDNEAQRLLKEIPLKWKPGTVRGKDVNVVTYYTVSFLKKGE